jgi:hypothetical protein
LIEAFTGVPRDAVTVKARIAAAAMHFQVSKEGRVFVDQCRSLLTDIIEKGGGEHDPSLITLSYYELGAALLREGKGESARALLEPYWKRHFENNAIAPWQLEWTRPNCGTA